MSYKLKFSRGEAEQLKRIKMMLFALAMMTVLSGCSAVRLTLNPQDLYALPKLPERYTALNQEISAILEAGAEYAVPAAGSNIQPVQMTDLDGDGREEALAFFRKVDDEKPLKICIFTAEGTGYRQSALIEGSGAAINSIAYSDLNGDGRLELLVGWRVSAELLALSVYELQGEEPRELIHTNYVKYTIADLNADGMRELVALHSNQEGVGVADCYGWIEEELALLDSTSVSMTMAELSRLGRLTVGTLEDETKALFVTGVADGSRAITDVLVLNQAGLSNCMLSDATGVTQSITAFRGLYPMDFNGDGLTEVPYPQVLPDLEDEDSDYYRIDWKTCNLNGTGKTVLSTYHDMDQNWYLQLPDEWREQITVNRSTSSEEINVTFYIYNKTGGEQQPFLRITTLIGTNRERQSLRTGRFVLRRENEAIYVAELLKENDNWQYGVTEDQVRGAFSLIAKEWTASDA